MNNNPHECGHLHRPGEPLTGLLYETLWLLPPPTRAHSAPRRRKHTRHPAHTMGQYVWVTGHRHSTSGCDRHTDPLTVGSHSTPPHPWPPLPHWQLPCLGEPVSHVPPQRVSVAGHRPGVSSSHTGPMPTQTQHSLSYTHTHNCCSLVPL